MMYRSISLRACVLLLCAILSISVCFPVSVFATEETADSSIPAETDLYSALLESEAEDPFNGFSAIFSGETQVLSTFDQQLASFPESYRAALIELHEKHSNWQFVAVDTGLSWQASVAGEIKGDSALIYNSTASPFYKNKEPDSYDPSTDTYIPKDGGTWIKTTESAMTFFLDPRNFLDDVSIFQFLLMSYDSSFQTQEGVEIILRGTFMSNTKVSYVNTNGDIVTTEDTYSDLIMEAATVSGVSPYYLASKIRQEVGANGSGSCSGNYTASDGTKYIGYYNFYNIGATSGSDPVANGLKYASTGSSYGRPWTSPRASILGGAQFLASSYIAQGQDTGYFIRFNVAPDSTYPAYTNQYMTNISGAVQEAITTRSAYNSMDMLDEQLVFAIPVFDNMPAQESQVRLNTYTGYAVSTDAVRVRTEPSMTASVVTMLSSGSTVSVQGTYRIQFNCNQSGLANHLRYPLWYKISFTQNGQTMTGYACAEYFTTTASRILGAGDTLQLSATVTPSISGETVYYESSNYQVATVSSTGIVTAVAPGTAVIRVYSSGGGMDSVKIEVSGLPFQDVPSIAWYYDSVSYVYSNGLFQGMTPKLFGPTRNMTRGMFVTVLGRLYGGTLSGSLEDFTDVPATTYYANSIAWAASNGIVGGYGDGTFRPETSITREQMAQILYQYAAYCGYSLSANTSVLDTFKDRNDISPWAESAMAWAVTYGILNGTDGALNSRDTATRSQVAAVIQRFAQVFE